MKVEELAPHMRHAGDFLDLVAIKLLIPRIAVGVQEAFVTAQIVLRPLTLSVSGVFVKRRQRRC